MEATYARAKAIPSIFAILSVGIKQRSRVINLFSKSGLLNSNKSFVLNKLSITFPTKKGVTPLRQLHANFGSLK